jgi:hypothetical protein
VVDLIFQFSYIHLAKCLANLTKAVLKVRALRENHKIGTVGPRPTVPSKPTNSLTDIRPDE